MQSDIRMLTNLTLCYIIHHDCYKIQKYDLLDNREKDRRNIPTSKFNILL